jgi:nicotinamidase-related amidase
MAPGRTPAIGIFESSDCVVSLTLRKSDSPLSPKAAIRIDRFGLFLMSAFGQKQTCVISCSVLEFYEQLLNTAKANEIEVFISPHYYYPTDHGWKFEGALEKVMHSIGMFDRPSAYSMEGFEGSGADFMPQYKKYLYDGKTIIASPHKVYGPEQNDLVLQLRKRHIDQVLLAGMSANLCVQAHMHELLEQGFEVAVIKDATAAAQIPEGDGYLAALVNFRFMANADWTTDEAVKRLSK